MSRFTKNSDNTVTDTKTGLIWSKETLGLDADKSGCFDTKKAEEFAASFGEGYRLPTVEELFSLVDHTKYSPAIDTEFFPDTKNDWYWTSTPCAWNETAVWVVGFHGGGVGSDPRYLGACVRAVRSSQ